jgi:hypothetical protein
MIGGDVRGTEFQPFALYSLIDIGEGEDEGEDPEMAKKTFSKLADELDESGRIDGLDDDNDVLRSIRLAPDSIFKQPTLAAALSAHTQYSQEHKDDLAYNHRGFVAIHARDWGKEGVFLVFADWEEGHRVTGFRYVVYACRSCSSKMDRGRLTIEQA